MTSEFRAGQTWSTTANAVILIRSVNAGLIRYTYVDSPDPEKLYDRAIGLTRGWRLLTDVL